MDTFLNSLFPLGSLPKGFPLTVSPCMDDFELLQFLRPSPHQGQKEGFRVLLNVAFLEASEIKLEVVDGKVLEIHAIHDRKCNPDGFWMSRNMKYAFEIPEEAQGKVLHVEWSEDGYLLVQATTREIKPESCEGRMRLIPERVQYALRPVVEISVLRDMISDTRDKAQKALNYIGARLKEVSNTVEKKAEESKTEEIEKQILEPFLGKEPERKMADALDKLKLEISAEERAEDETSEEIDKPILEISIDEKAEELTKAMEKLTSKICAVGNVEAVTEEKEKLTSEICAVGKVETVAEEMEKLISEICAVGKVEAVTEEMEKQTSEMCAEEKAEAVTEKTEKLTSEMCAEEKAEEATEGIEKLISKSFKEKKSEKEMADTLEKMKLEISDEEKAEEEIAEKIEKLEFETSLENCSMNNSCVNGQTIPIVELNTHS